ncbi:tryptophan-rich sensory protein [Brachybacterium sp. FME24]|uniref:tryptophan-rich sensory protein n=1 Tax=Brachybacterium sp. FME24 TaxID=2742605 RepID=UPI001D010071|nr:tryptophan-rich sensory protein [Brachybacterium sp. FME24]
MTTARPDGDPVARASLRRRIAVTLSFLVAMVGTSIGVGAFGGDPIAEAAGGLLAADATHLSPAGSAFSIWSVIYVGLGAYTLWQWWDPRDERGIARHAIASLLLNAAWILVIQAGWVWLSVLVIAALLAVLADLFRRTTARPPRGPVGRLVVDGTFGLYLGWVSVAACANIAAALAGSGFRGFGIPAVIAVAVLAVVAVVGVALCVAGRRPIAAPLAMIWGLVWIAVGRASDQPHSPTTAVAAGLVAAVIAIAALAQWRRRTPNGARA